ncbi:MAG: arylsulfatase [Verrucomicrobiales bacterium]|nr:arylsulfatase [Verrucomicrobiales bacterium]
MQRLVLLSCLIGSGLMCAAGFEVQAVSAAPAPKSSNPNIVIILADDLGYGSLGCYGADTNLIRTPNCDRLAREGIRFTDAYAPASICTPTRYALLTGRYCWRTSLQFGVLPYDAPLLIETNRPTVASVLKRRGYQTAAIGKWHLGYGSPPKTDYTGPLRPGPLQLGFDYHFAVPCNHGDVTGVYVENESVAGLRSTKLAPFGASDYGGKPFLGLDAPQRTNETVMAVLTDKAVNWIAQQRPGKPFFLYFNPVAVHEPVTPSRATAGTSKAGPYGDWIHELDLSVGRILEALDRAGLARDTLVIFSSDNGGENKLRGTGTQLQAQQAGLKINGPFRAGKHSIFEGGLRVPLLVRWPGRTPAGGVSPEPISLVDVFATAAAIVGEPLPPPDRAAEDSVNMLPAILGERRDEPLRNDLIVHSADGVFAIRQGPWKFIGGIPARKGGGGGIADKAAENRRQLYNLAEDPGEQRDLIDRHPEIAARLAKLLEDQRHAGHSRP